MSDSANMMPYAIAIAVLLLILPLLFYNTFCKEKQELRNQSGKFSSFFVEKRCLERGWVGKVGIKKESVWNALLGLVGIE